MTRVLDSSGAQILPASTDDRRTVTGWLAVLCCSADQRTKHQEYAELAATLKVHP